MVGWVALLAELVIVVTTSIVAEAVYHWIAFDDLSSVGSAFGIGLIVSANFLAVSAARGSYRPENLVNFKKQIPDVTLIWAFVILILLSVAFSLKISGTFSRGSTITLFILGWSAILVWRGLLAHFLRRALADGAFAQRNILVIAEKDRLNSSRILHELERCGYKPVMTFEIKQSEVEAFGVSRSLHETLDEVIKISRQEPIQDLFLLIKWDHSRLIDDILQILRVVPLPIHLVPDENVARFMTTPVVHMGKAWTATLKRAPLSVAEQLLKRSIDVLGAGLGLVLLSPLMLITALIIKLDSEGPVFFTQTRNGFNGRSFRIFKFRTMGVLEDGPQIRQATRNDPRVTRVGRWLRRTSIDELPQLFNVLGGSMSLVGPRPHAAAHNTEYEKLIANYAFRHHVKPGITGWAQVNGFRGETATVNLMEERVKLDLWYVNNWSFWLDIRIVWNTFLMVIWQSKAY
jgi:Undecaprenyl-phosphate glucose phosphotransferase